MTKKMILLPAFDGPVVEKGRMRPKMKPNLGRVDKLNNRLPDNAYLLAYTELKEVIRHARQMVGPHAFAEQTQQWLDDFVAVLDEIEATYQSGNLHIGEQFSVKNDDCFSSLKTILDDESNGLGTIPAEWDDSITDFIDNMLEYWVTAVKWYGQAFSEVLSGSITVWEVVDSFKHLSKVTYPARPSTDTSVQRGDSVPGANEVDGGLVGWDCSFSGRLYYDDDTKEHLDVSSFILRDKEVAFSLASVSIEHGRWDVSGIALLQDDGSYVAKRLLASKMKVSADNPWDIVFRADVIEKDLLLVEGYILEGGNRFEFEGELERSSNQLQIRKQR
jgi:hypothetical protein